MRTLPNSSTSKITKNNRTTTPTTAKNNNNTISSTSMSMSIPMSPSILEDEDDNRVVIGLCTDMCPLQERIQRISEHDIHKLEKIFLTSTGTSTLDVHTSRSCMIKKCQRSAADHKLNIPQLVRTPRTLLRTIEYIENNIMDLDRVELSPLTSTSISISTSVDPLELYLFIWDRLRMIAKDFILQNYRYSGRVDGVGIACHEHMARWFIMMEHQMQCVTDFALMHAHQNKEQLNKILKTLNEFYDHAAEYGQNSRVRTDNTNGVTDLTKMCGNEAEFRAYYALSQLYNPSEVQRYLSRLSPHVLNQPPVQFVLK
eukprot:gene11279-23594_t